MSDPMQRWLPADIVDELRKAEPVLALNKWNAAHVERVLSILDTLPPAMVVRADYELRWVLGLYDSAPYGTAYWRPGSILAAQDVARLARVPDLAYLFLFHSNGRLRERALECLRSGARSPFFLAAIALRLNDWAAPVRSAAVACADTVFPLTDSSIVEAAAYFLLAQRYEWCRWTVTETAPLDRALQRADVAERLIGTLLDATSGPVGPLFRSALRGTGFDRWLPRLALEARHPELRKVALQALIQRTVRWPSHRERRWIDKSQGRYREALVFASRPVESDVLAEQALMMAARDQSVTVRRIAVITLLTEGRSLAGFAEAAALLINDKNRALRERTAYALSLG